MMIVEGLDLDHVERIYCIFSLLVVCFASSSPIVISLINKSTLGIFSMTTMRVQLRWMPRGHCRVTDIPSRCVFTGEVRIIITHPSLPLVPELDFTVPVTLELAMPPGLVRYTTFHRSRRRPASSTSSQLSRMAAMVGPDSPRYSPTFEASNSLSMRTDAHDLFDDISKEEEEPEEDPSSDE